MSTTPLSRRTRKARLRLRALRKFLSELEKANHIEKCADFDRGERPVLLLQGFLATRRSFDVMERRLRKDGFCVFSLNLGGLKDAFNNRSIDDLGRHVAAKIEKLYRRHPHMGPLTIVGHSKGGLVGAHYVKHLGGHERVRTLITIGTPHNGTPLALLGFLISPFARSVFQMFPGSPFLHRLRKTPTPPSVFQVSLWSKQDRTCPHPAALLREQSPNVCNVEVDAPHFELLHRKAVYEVVREQIAAGEAWARRPWVLRLHSAWEQEGAAALLEANGSMGLPV